MMVVRNLTDWMKKYKLLNAQARERQFVQDMFDEATEALSHKKISRLSLERIQSFAGLYADLFTGGIQYEEANEKEQRP